VLVSTIDRLIDRGLNDYRGNVEREGRSDGNRIARTMRMRKRTRRGWKGVRMRP